MNWLMKRALRYGYARLREASTWRNVILLAGGSWAAIHPGQAELLVPVCMGIAGFIGSFFPDLLGAPRENLPPIELQGHASPDVSAADFGVVEPDRVRPLALPAQNHADQSAALDPNPPGFNG